MLVSKTDILSVIPQRAPFVMVDELLEANKKEFTASFKIKNTNIFVNNNVFSESGIIESVAQACAAGYGYLMKSERLEEQKVGFIGAVSKLNVNESVLVGDCINISISRLNSFENIELVEGKVYIKDTVILECQLKIVLQ